MLKRENNNRAGGSFLWIIILFIVIFIMLPVVYYFLGQSYHMRGIAMEPLYKDESYLFIYRSFNPRSLKQGDVVFFRNPVSKDRVEIKRIIGVPNDTVTLEKQGIIKVNNVVIDEPYATISPDLQDETLFVKEGETVTVPPDEYFVLGDNRARSYDSLHWGFLPAQNVIGTVGFCYWDCK